MVSAREMALAMAMLESHARTLRNDLIDEADTVLDSDPAAHRVRASALREAADLIEERLLKRRRVSDPPFRWAFTFTELTGALTRIRASVAPDGPMKGELSAEDFADALIRALNEE